jgi:two-component system, NarL family, sensor histidine kinase DevS
LLGQLVLDARPLRLSDVSRDPRSYGFPSVHPEMRSFVGVPIMIDGEPWGNLYFADDDVDTFDDADERAAAALAVAAAAVVERFRSQLPQRRLLALRSPV